MNPDNVAPATTHPDPPATAPVPVEITSDDSRTWERALSSVKDVIVIVTCLAVLYTLWRGYVLAAELGAALQNLSSTFGAGL